MSPVPGERYMVLVERNGSTSAPALDVTRAEAWRLARRLKGEDGARVWVMRTDGEHPECVVSDDDVIAESSAKLPDS